MIRLTTSSSVFELETELDDDLGLRILEIKASSCSCFLDVTDVRTWRQNRDYIIRRLFLHNLTTVIQSVALDWLSAGLAHPGDHCNQADSYPKKPVLSSFPVHSLTFFPSSHKTPWLCFLLEIAQGLSLLHSHFAID